MLSLRQAGSALIARGPAVLTTPYLTTNGIFTGDADRHVVNLDKVTLKERWRTKTKLQVRGGFGDLVLLAYYDEMEAWTPDGKAIWKRKTSQNYCRSGAKMYFLEARLEVVDVMTGRLQEAMECPLGAPDLIIGDVLLVTDPLHTDPVRAFSLRERRVIWERALVQELREIEGVDQPGFALALAASGENRCIAARGGHLLGMSIEDGSWLWKTPVHVPYFGVQLRDDRIYVWTTTLASTSTRVTLDIGSGQVMRERSEPTTADNHFVIVDDATGEVVLDRQLGPFGEAFRRFQEVQRGTLCKNHIVFTTQSGLMAVFRLSDGELVWQRQHRDQLFYPVFEDNRLYVACADGTLVVFEAEGGEL